MNLFITFEGVEGCGKTTQMEMLKEHLEWKGFQVVSTREPGGSDLGEKIRGLLLNADSEGITPWAELMLYAASRAQLVSEVIKPALDEKKVILCDRFADSTVVYQGFVRGLNLDAIQKINAWATQGVEPSLTFIIDCPTDVGLKRAFSRINRRADGNREDRFEKEGHEFHEKVRQGYLKLAKETPKRIQVINGDRDIPVIHKEICGIIDKLQTKSS